MSKRVLIVDAKPGLEQLKRMVEEGKVIIQPDLSSEINIPATYASDAIWYAAGNPHPKRSERMSSEVITIFDEIDNVLARNIREEEKLDAVIAIVRKELAKASAIDNQPSRAQQMEELLRELVKLEPTENDDEDKYCVFCTADKSLTESGDLEHDKGCLITRAKQLLEVG